jgi:hypothetical protein
MALFSYPITRPVLLPHFLPVAVAVTFLYVLIVVLISVIGQGYETINYTSYDYNGTHNLWFDRFVRNKEPGYNHRSCENAQIKLNDCIDFHTSSAKDSLIDN